MRSQVVLFLLAASLAKAAVSGLVTDYTTYNTGDQVQVRVAAGAGTAAIRYAGEDKPFAAGIAIGSNSYQPLWRVPQNARTGRYLVDFKASGSHVLIQGATSFAVHRQLAKIMSIDLDKTFYTVGDSIDSRIVVKNLSQQKLSDLQVEFEPYTFPWIAPEPGEKPVWKKIVAPSLSLAPGEQKIFDLPHATTAEVDNHQPEAQYYCVVIRNSRDPDRVYDLAFAQPAFTVPPNKFYPKQYPFLYLYQHLADVPKSQSYRDFYPPQFVSDVIHFETGHTMFRAGEAETLALSVDDTKRQLGDAHLRLLVTDKTGHELQSEAARGALGGAHRIMVKALPPGGYTLHASIETASGAVLAHSQLEFAVNELPQSILIFLAHQDDDTAHPALIRAAVENHIPIHFVYLTSGDSGGCERFYMHSCDSARAMDFGEVREGEARASLAHMGVPAEDIQFLGLPDGGLEQIWYHHRTASDPYLSVLLACDHAPYSDAAIPNLPYAREPIVAAIKQLILKYGPEMIVTGHPDERHVDHRTNNWLVVEAMQQLLREGKLSRGTKLLVDVSYGARPGRHAPYRYDKDVFYASGEAARLGQEALWYYQSQEGNHQQAEIKDFLALPRTEAYPHFWIKDWWAHQGWNEKP